MDLKSFKSTFYQPNFQKFTKHFPQPNIVVKKGTNTEIYNTKAKDMNTPKVPRRRLSPRNSDHFCSNYHVVRALVPSPSSDIMLNLNYYQTKLMWINAYLCVEPIPR